MEIIRMKLFVAGLPFAMDDSEFSQIFEQHGTVASAKIITDRETRKSRGFGFIEMPDKTEAQNAIKQLDGSQINGRTLSVKEAEERPSNNQGRGGYGGGGGGNRNRY